MKKERFWGLHFDFHANGSTPIGARTDPADITWYLDEARPDFVQCDCKGHPGLCSWPTQTGAADPMLQADNLQIWADTVHGRGLPLFVHYSGVWDKTYTAANPRHAAADRDGNPTEKISLFGPYCDDVLIPQMKELSRRYGIDGCWVDGDCWAVERDHSPMAQPHLRPGITADEHNAVMRRAFLDYVRHYTDAIHAFAPDFLVASNWLYSELSPEKPDIAVDFISGDLTPNNSAHEVRFSARCMAHQGKPWDLMAWSFALEPEHNYHMAKSARQLMQEAALVLSQGGGFQVYITQNADGSARQEAGHRFAELGAFVRQRHCCFGLPPLAQLGILFDTAHYYRQQPERAGVFLQPPLLAPLRGMLQCALDAQYTADVVLTHQLAGAAKYPLLLVPEQGSMDEDLQKQLLAYAQNGGHLVVTGAALCRLFAGLTGTPVGELRPNSSCALLCSEGHFFSFGDDVLDLGTGQGALYTNADLRDGQLSGWRTQPLGAGSITFIPFSLGLLYSRQQLFHLTEHLAAVLGSLQAPWITVDRQNVDIIPQQTADGLLVNLVNLNQSRHSLGYGVFQQVPPVQDVQVRIEGSWQQVQVLTGEAFTCQLTPTAAIVRLPQLDIHTVIQLR